MKISTLFLMLFTLVAFAANSILCRQALMTGSIGPVEFTAVRLGSGIIALLPVVLFHKSLFRSSSTESSDGSVLLRVRISNSWQAMALFAYAIFFSLAYVQLDAGTGALILFASVQISMIGISIIGGNRVALFEWIGLVISFSGLFYLLLPGLSAPPLVGTTLMIASGASWGVYSLLGQNQSRPILSTARNFLFCLPGVIILGLIVMENMSGQERAVLSSDGILLAVISGAVASGMGYVLWYMTVRRISTTVAAVSQLVVPIFAAIGGIIFLNEILSLRLVVASILIISGILMAILGRRPSK
jgi:drug/metabolite transporter (DMT)-like permease